MDILLYQEQSSSVFRSDVKWQQLGNSTGILIQLEIPLDHLTNFESTAGQ